MCVSTVDLGEGVEVSEREGERDLLVEFDLHAVLVVVDGCVLLARDAARAEIAGHAELDAILGGGNLDRVADHGDLRADALELGRRHLDTQRRAAHRTNKRE